MTVSLTIRDIEDVVVLAIATLAGLVFVTQDLLIIDGYLSGTLYSMVALLQFQLVCWTLTTVLLAIRIFWLKSR